MRDGREPLSNRPKPISPQPPARPASLAAANGARSPALRICRYDIYRDRAAHQSPRYTGLFLAATSVLRLINAGTSDGRRFSAAPQAKDRSAWRIVQTAVPSLTDKPAQDVIDSWLRTKAPRNQVISRPCRSAALSRVVCDTPRRACGSLLIHFRTVAHLTRHRLSDPPITRDQRPMFLCSTPDIRWPARLPEFRPFIVERATTFGCGSRPRFGVRPRHS